MMSELNGDVPPPVPERNSPRATRSRIGMMSARRLSDGWMVKSADAAVATMMPHMPSRAAGHTLKSMLGEMTTARTAAEKASARGSCLRKGDGLSTRMTSLIHS
jgi:hypothetical protein